MASSRRYTVLYAPPVACASAKNKIHKYSSNRQTLCNSSDISLKISLFSSPPLLLLLFYPLHQVSPEQFQAAFHAPMEKASELIAAKTLTIGKLVAICPPGTYDPTPHIYDTTMYTLSGLMATAIVAHALVKPINTIPVTATKPPVVVDTPVETKTGDREVKN